MFKRKKAEKKVFLHTKKRCHSPSESHQMKDGDICGPQKGPHPAVHTGEGLVRAVPGYLGVLEI